MTPELPSASSTSEAYLPDIQCEPHSWGRSASEILILICDIARKLRDKKLKHAKRQARKTYVVLIVYLTTQVSFDEFA